MVFFKYYISIDSVGNLLFLSQSYTIDARHSNFIVHCKLQLMVARFRTEYFPQQNWTAATMVADDSRHGSSHTCIYIDTCTTVTDYTDDNLTLKHI